MIHLLSLLMLLSPAFAKPKKTQSTTSTTTTTVVTTSVAAVKDEAKLVVNIEGIKEVKGQLLLSLFDQPEGFPRDKEKAKSYTTPKVTGEKMAITYDKLKPGFYAFSVIHDANENGKPDLKKVLFVPVGLAEGAGASNNAKGSMGPPKFEDAKFEVKAPETQITVKLDY